MYHVYILYSSKSDGFYFGSTPDVKKRLHKHNLGQVTSTKPYTPWKLIWYGSFVERKLAENFEIYLKSGSGKAFAYKRLIQSGVSRKMGG
jgi:putative endonuclease